MIYAIFAMDSRGGLGFKGDLPWGRIPDDMKHFKSITENHIVVMGKKTWNGLPNKYKPLPKRINAVVSSGGTSHPDFFIYNIKPYNIKEQLLAIQVLFPEKKIFIIGGGQLLSSCVDIIDFIYLTRIQGSYENDVKLNVRKFFDNFQLTTTRPPVNKCTFEEYKHI